MACGTPKAEKEEAALFREKCRVLARLNVDFTIDYSRRLT